jgi:serine/threonine protein kinase
MLHSQYLQKGAAVELPELSGYFPDGSPTFTVKGVFAGGMGICVHLLHAQSGTEYALKGVRPDHIDKESTVERFLDELRVWLSASACSLIAEAVAVVSINETPCVLATWMPNGDLSSALPRLNKSEKIEILLRIIRGLEWANSNLGVIHRDLKPSNILLDDHNLAYVADWGLARPVGQALERVGTKLSSGSVDRPNRTQEGSFLGTVTYAAPEQIMGSNSIDHRADIYALGCMMYEFETGAPPFMGQTVNEIASKHIQGKPKKLGGWFKTTELGLEHIISRCLEKAPRDRYATYKELEKELLVVANRTGVQLDRCKVGIRYSRTVLGKGAPQQDATIHSHALNLNAEYAVVDAAQIQPFLEEAANLMALRRFDEAEKLLRPHVVPDFLGGVDWGPQHSISVNYGLCLLKLGKTLEADALLHSLTRAKPKPSEFFINYSLVMLKKGDWQSAIDICEEGLVSFPSDPDIQGNLTIALMSSGDLSAATDSALKRIGIRRDIHALEEGVVLLLKQGMELRHRDLPRAIKLAKTAGDLIKEGKRLNPRFFSLHQNEVVLRRFAYDEQKVLSLVQAMMDNADCPPTYRNEAFIQMVEMMSEGKSFEAALNLIEKSQQPNESRLNSIKLKTLARRRMVGKEFQDGRRVVIREVCDHFLAESETGCYSYPVLAAEIKDWLGDDKAAMAILDAHLSKDPNDWDGIKLMAMIYLRQGYFNRAVDIAQLLVKRAPWRAESYDWLAHIAEKAGRNELVASVKIKGDEIFTQEDRLYTELRTHLDSTLEDNL